VDRVRLDGIELRWLDLRLRTPHRSASGSVVARPVVVARVLTESCEGWGECAALPAPDYSEEYALGAWEVLARHLVPAVLSAAGPGREVDPENLLEAVSEVRGHAMAKACLEMGFLDAGLRASARSLSDLLGVTQGSVATGTVIGLPEGRDPEQVDRMAGSAAKLVAEGYRRLKVKIAPWVPPDALRALCEAVPEAVVIADANGTFRISDPEHLKTLLSIDALGLSGIEQPLDPDDLVGHSRLAERLETRICLDESASSLGRIVEAIEYGAADMVCIKPARLGGILQAVRAQAICAEAGIPAYCGGMLESNLARTANAALCGLPGMTLPGDVQSGERFEEKDPFLSDVELREVGRPGPEVTIHREPGVGPAPDRQALEVVTSHKEWFPA